MASEVILKNMSPDPIRLSYGGKTFLWAGVDGVTGDAIPFVLTKIKKVIEHKTVKGNHRQLPGHEKVFVPFKKGTFVNPVTDVLVTEVMHKVGAKEASIIISMSGGKLKQFAVQNVEVIDAVSRVNIEKRMLEAEAGRLAAELAALKEESEKMSKAQQAELQKMREELAASLSKHTNKSKG